MKAVLSFTDTLEDPKGYWPAIFDSISDILCVILLELPPPTQENFFSSSRRSSSCSMASSPVRDAVVKKEPSLRSSGVYEPTYPLGEIFIYQYTYIC